MDKKIYEARETLKSDLADCPHVLQDPLGHAITFKKIQDYIFVCVLANQEEVECKEWLYKLYEGQAENNKNIFLIRIDLIITTLYTFYNYLQKVGKV